MYMYVYFQNNILFKTVETNQFIRLKALISLSVFFKIKIK